MWDLWDGGLRSEALLYGGAPWTLLSEGHSRRYAAFRVGLACGTLGALSKGESCRPYWPEVRPVPYWPEEAEAFCASVVVGGFLLAALHLKSIEYFL